MHFILWYHTLLLHNPIFLILAFNKSKSKASLQIVQVPKQFHFNLSSVALITSKVNKLNHNHKQVDELTRPTVPASNVAVWLSRHAPLLRCSPLGEPLDYVVTRGLFFSSLYYSSVRYMILSYELILY